MHNLKYSAGLISQSFWFIEFKKVLNVYQKTQNFSETKKFCINNNVLLINNEYRSKRTCAYIVNRLKALDNSTINLFYSSDLATQKLINLIAILKGDSLFFEFVYEIYRDKHILGYKTLNKTDGKTFFKNKEVQSNIVATWKDDTKNRLASIYINYLTDSNLLTTHKKEKIITPAILSPALEQNLIDNNEKAIIKALTGVK